LNKTHLRTIKLLEMLREQKRLDIATVVKTLKICEATARRLFSVLETEGKLIRVHGGIQMAPQLESDYSYRASAVKQQAEKNAIGLASANVVSSGEKIFLDSGTTVLKMAEALAGRIRRGEVKDITVVTNSMSYLNNLAEVCKVLLVGGAIRPERRDVCGPIAESNLAKFRFDKTFFGTDAISLEGDLMATDEATCRMNEIAIEQSAKNYLLATADKFGQSSFVEFGRLNSKFTVFTDPKISPATIKTLKKTKAVIIIV
jgi:DeoR family transcriptional regulator, fructose operon transcriptional repressor